MSGSYSKHIEALEVIMQNLADVWPGDRENIMVAGAQLEDVIEAFKGKSQLLTDMISGAWQGMIHLYEKDEYFFSVKAATMQAVNTIREFAVQDGDIAVEVFEKALEDLEKALSGDGESADKIIERPPADAPSEEEAVTLDDLASLIMKISPESVTKDDLQNLERKFETALKTLDTPLKSAVKGALESIMLAKQGRQDNAEVWIATVSKKLEEAVEIEMQLMNDESKADTENEEPSSETTLSATESEANPKADTGPDPATTPESVKATESEPDSETSPADSASPETGSGAQSSPGTDPGTESESDTSPATYTISQDIDQDLLPDFISECTEQIEQAEGALLDLEASPNDSELINMVFRSFHTIKGTSAFMGLMPISEFAHSVETLLDLVRDEHIPYDSACADITLSSIDIIKSFLNSISDKSGGDVITYPDGYADLMKVLSLVSEYGMAPEEARSENQTEEGNTETDQDAGLDKETHQNDWGLDPEPVKETRQNDGDRDAEPVGKPEEVVGENPADSSDVVAGTPERDHPDERKAAQDERKAAQKAEINKNGSAVSQKKDGDATVRVNMDRLDRLIDMVGELVIAHSVVAQDPQIISDPEISRKVTHSTKILRELQDTSLTLRMVPLKATFQKMNRLVRDLAKKGGKTAKLITVGEDTEIDRNMVDIINEPLVHLLRNAIDHGIENNEERSASGKPGIANIWLRAFQAGGKVIIEIEDDGKGLNKEKILRKAVSRELIEPNKKLSDSEIFKLIFLPGFSTADKVTDLSGRGVGMDVVRQSIDKLQGKVEVSSKEGKGTKISLELPFTLAITDGMLVQIGNQQFIVPTINIDMTFRAKEEELFTVFGNSEQVKFRGDSIPVIRLHRMFHIPNAVENILEGTLLVINNNNKKYALLVDEVVGQQQLVGKSINMPIKMNNISGGAILGDGKVGLILDTVALLN